MKSLKTFNIDGEMFYDSEVYEFADLAIVTHDGAEWLKGEILLCRTPAINDLPPSFQSLKIKDEESFVHPEYIEPLWVYNSKNIIDFYSKDLYLTFNAEYKIKVPLDVLIHLVKYTERVINLLSVTVPFEISYLVGASWKSGLLDLFRSIKTNEDVQKKLAVPPFTQQFLQQLLQQNAHIKNTNNNSPYQFATHAKIVTGDVFCGTSASQQRATTGSRPCSVGSRAKIII